MSSNRCETCYGEGELAVCCQCGEECEDCACDPRPECDPKRVTCPECDGCGEVEADDPEDV